MIRHSTAAVAINHHGKNQVVKNSIDNGPPNTNDHKQRDNIRQRKLQAIRIVEEFLQTASDPKFSGSLILEMPAKDGRIGRVKHSRITFEPD